MKTIAVTFETSGTTKDYPAHKIEKLHDYHGAHTGNFTDRARTQFKVPAPTSELDLNHLLSKMK